MTGIRFGYADGAHGQLHYRALGEGEPLLLLHWAPSSGRMYEHVMPLFAAAGLRVLAFDVPGYGRSHKNASGWTLAQCAQELVIGLDALGVRRGFAVGGHFSAAIVAELAIAAPERWPRLVLDGSPTLTPEQMGALMKAFADLSPALSPTGSHKSFAWDMTERFLREWDPRFEVAHESLPVHYAYMSDYLEMGFEPIRAFLEPGARPRTARAPRAASPRAPAR